MPPLSLRATLDWSYKLLPEPGQELFRRLGVFAGPFDAAAAAAVTAACDAEAILARLTELADQSLLEITPGAAPLFRLLQTVSEYASAQLAEVGEQAGARRRHLAYYLRLDVGLRLATAAGPLWRWGSRFAEGDLQLSRLLAADGQRERDTTTPARARAVLEAGDLARVSGHFEQAAELGRLAIEMCQDIERGNQRGIVIIPGTVRRSRFVPRAASVRWRVCWCRAGCGCG